MASPSQFAVAGSIFAAMILLALVSPKSKGASVNGKVPSNWICGVLAISLGALALWTPRSLNWGATSVLLLCDIFALGFVLYCSRRSGWNPTHKLALASGAALAYGLHSFTQQPVMGAGALARVGNGVFLAIALGIIVLASRRLSGELSKVG